MSPPILFGVDPTAHRHPHFGIYVSPRGAVTRLHVDGGESDAVLCQLYGEKRCYLIAPTLGPGDTLFIPRGFIHEVYTLSASVSLTCNFVHLSDSFGWSGWARLPDSLRARARRVAARARTLLQTRPRRA